MKFITVLFHTQSSQSNRMLFGLVDLMKFVAVSFHTNMIKGK